MEVTHLPLGLLAVLIGWTRWLELRLPAPDRRVAGRLWPPAMALIGLGFRSISMAPASIGPVKSMVLSLDAGMLERWLQTNMHSGEGSLRGGLKRFAEEQGVEI